MSPETTPVIIAVGECVDRPERIADAREPVDLIAAALRACEEDAGVALLPAITRLSLVGLVSWRYRDPVRLLADRLGIAPAAAVNASMGGETPVRLLHEAALRIAAGEDLVAAVAGGEAAHSRARARRENATLAWTPPEPRATAVRFPSSRYATSAVASALGVTDPAQVYPLYETATQAAWGETPAQARRAAAALWQRYATVAAGNPSAWLRTAPDAETIATAGPDNRMIAWPYPKLMVANPAVNQAAGYIVASLARARALGVPRARIVHVWGGAYAAEPEDYLARDRYDRSTAQRAVLRRALALVDGDAARFDRIELYSCFPVVPRMALRELGLDEAGAQPTVTGGLTFFGGPLNNYMSHAVAAMVRALRADAGGIGLLYGQGGYVNTHQTLVLGAAPPPAAIDGDDRAQAEADALRDPVPPLAPDYEGRAEIEAYTAPYARDGDPVQGIVVARTPDGRRVMARVPAADRDGIALLTSAERNAVGTIGHVHIDAFGKPVWSRAPQLRPAPLRHCRVERDGPVTIVTIARPDAMNALHPDANAELAGIFDDFAADPEQWIAILTGAGERAFCAGNDLKETARRMARGEPIDIPRSGFAGLTGRFDLDKPVIAAVNGIAMGGGFEIALACDLIVAADTAVFALPEPRVGLAALEGGLHRLPREIGLKRAMGMILTGRHVGAAEGHELGFVHAVVPPDRVMAAARALAAAMLDLSPMSLRASKQVVRRGLEEPGLAAARAAQGHYPAVRALFRSADSREGPLAFAQKRKPVWKGR